MSNSDILYFRLKEAEVFNDKVADAEKRLLKDIEEVFTKFGEKTPEPIRVDILRIDVPATQKSIMLEYAGNQVFDDAVSGKKSVEQAYNELAEVNKGFRKFLPRRKNDKHNNRVKDLVQLTGGFADWSLGTNGIFYPDNFVTGAAFCAGLSVIVPYALSTLIIGGITDEQSLRHAEVMREYTPMFLAPVMGVIGGISLQLRGRGWSKINEEAKYIDGKINEFCNEEEK